MASALPDMISALFKRLSANPVSLPFSVNFFRFFAVYISPFSFVTKFGKEVLRLLISTCTATDSCRVHLKVISRA